jgi:CheY-like chemotaxis protein
MLIDIGIPGRDGYQLAREVRRELGTEPLLIALTGYGQAEDRRRALEAGFDEHLTKPVDLGTLELALAWKRPG